MWAHSRSWFSWVLVGLSLFGGTSAMAEDPPGGLHGFLQPENEARRPATTGTSDTQQDALYRRPFVASARTAHSRTAIGGYLEANSNYFVEDGISEGFGMEFRRFNLFVYSSIADRIKLMSELEFEHGTEEIALETAQIDFLIHSSIGLRAGILLPPIGRFNANHDSPQYEFVERPWVSERIIPSTLSEVGGGLFGKFFIRDATLTYDFYVVNGLQDGIVLNSDARTFIPAGKTEDIVAEDNNGRPAYTARVGLAHPSFGEFGVSHYGGAYNTFKLDGERIAPRRQVHMTAFDLDVEIFSLVLQGEAVLAHIDVPDDLGELFGDTQYGFYLDMIYPVYAFNWLHEAESVLNLAARVERVDFNVGSFTSGLAAGDKIFDEETGLAVGLSLRPVPDTVIRVNYRRHWVRDLLGNPSPAIAGVQVGLATYF